MKSKVLVILFATVCYLPTFACTSAIVGVNRSAEDGVILWKHRDNSTHDTSVFYISGGEYAYVVLTNSYYSRRSTVYAGLNEAGLGVMNTATKNLYSSKGVELTAVDEINDPSSPHFASVILSSCTTVDEAEKIIASRPRYRSFQTNLAVGDSTGAAAYFEIWGNGYKRYDVTATADGYDIRTNFSFAGNDSRRGKSERRYDTMKEVMSAHKGKFSVSDFLNYSRSYYSSTMGKNILKECSEYKDDNYCVPRSSSVANIVLVCGPNARMVVVNGHPTAGMAIPVWVAQKNNLPKCLRPGGDAHRLSCEYVSKAYDKSNHLNIPLARKINGIKPPYIDPKAMPSDINAWNDLIDRTFTVYATKVRKSLK